ncbi:Helitron helicase [Phytophthora megakarya]|uniref:ATP-dependent DNA helicase n=1 Tax=Phytophthora megakarya TaxID=4795 RepID=A0A225UVP5_9STRA|nr:Helitron helicase [Phytophthora megakarya]
MNRGFFEAVDRVVREIMKNDSESSGGNVFIFSGVHRQILPVLKDATRSETKTACFENPGGAADLAKFSEFLLQIGEGRYPVNEDIGEGVICPPHDMHPLEVPPVLGELRDEDAETDRFQTKTHIPFMVDDDASYSDNVPRDADDADDDRRTHNINDLIDAVYPGTNADELPNEYFIERTILLPTNASVGRINEMVVARITAETKEYLSTDRRSHRQGPVRTGVPKLTQLLRNAAPQDRIEGWDPDHL